MGGRALLGRPPFTCTSSQYMQMKISCSTLNTKQVTSKEVYSPTSFSYS